MLENLKKMDYCLGMSIKEIKMEPEKKSWIAAVRFTKDEKALNTKARQILHVDMPTLYHDAIVAMSLDIVRRHENGSN